MINLRHISLLLVSWLAWVALNACAAETKDPVDLTAPIAPPSTMYEGGKAHFNKRLPEIAAHAPLNGGMLLAGDSITEAWLWHESFLPLPSSNHGVSWDTAEGLRSRLPQILQHTPDHLFILIGTNDIGYGHSAEHVAGHVRETVKTLQRKKPDTKIYIQAVLPRETQSLEKVSAYNLALRAVAAQTNAEFLDMTDKFAAADGTLISDYTEDGLHLNEKGYAVWGDILSSVVKASSK